MSAMALSVPDPRSLIAGTFRRVLGSQDHEPGRFGRGAAGDPGLLGADSPAWTVHADLSGFVGGIRALFLQALHPLAMAGVADHSSFREDPLGRLQRTGAFLASTIYGDTEEAERAIEQVRRIHVRVRGTAPDGRPYSAGDPDLLAWVHITEVDSFLVAYQRFGRGHLSAAEADRYVADMAIIGERLGAIDLPRTKADLRAALDAYRPDLAVGDQARDAVRFLLAPPIPLIARPPYALLLGGAVGLLPRWSRSMLRLPTVPMLDPLALRPAAGALLAGLGWALGENPTLRAARARAAA
jgi:uncharacterized protein (DUF2236 family)